MPAAKFVSHGISLLIISKTHKELAQVHELKEIILKLSAKHFIQNINHLQTELRKPQSKDR